MTREALKQALEALENIDSWLPTIGQKGLRDYEADAITAIKAALAQPEQEPDLAEAFRTELDKLSQRNYELRMENARLKAQPDQEPVAWGIVASNTGRICQVSLDADEVADHKPEYIKPLFASPPKRQPLTNEQIDEIFCKIVDDFEAGKVEYESHGLARAIEAAHGIKE